MGFAGVTGREAGSARHQKVALPLFHTEETGVTCFDGRGEGVVESMITGEGREEKFDVGFSLVLTSS